MGAIVSRGGSVAAGFGGRGWAGPELCATAWHATFPPLVLVGIGLAPRAVSSVPLCHWEWGGWHATPHPVVARSPDRATTGSRGICRERKYLCRAARFYGKGRTKMRCVALRLAHTRGPITHPETVIGGVRGVTCRAVSPSTSHSNVTNAVVINTCACFRVTYRLVDVFFDKSLARTSETTRSLRQRATNHRSPSLKRGGASPASDSRCSPTSTRYPIAG